MAQTSASAGRVLFINKGTWTTGTAYTVMDYVYYNGSTYTCKSALTSTTTPDLDTTHWQVMAYGFDPTALNALKAMITPDNSFSCTINGVAYTSAQTAINAVNALFADRTPIGDAWSSATAYTAGQYAINNNTLYRALTNVPAGTLVTDTNYWAPTIVTDELESHATNIATNASAISTLNSDLNGYKFVPFSENFDNVTPSIGGNVTKTFNLALSGYTLEGYIHKTLSGSNNGNLTPVTSISGNQFSVLIWRYTSEYGVCTGIRGILVYKKA